MTSNERCWEFDRYTDGRLKAEGIRVTRAGTEAEAREKAARMAYPGDVLVLRAPETGALLGNDILSCLDAHASEHPLLSQAAKAIRELQAVIASSQMTSDDANRLSAEKHWGHGPKGPAAETKAEAASCVYTPPDDGTMWLTGCGHEHHKDADLDLYDFCPYCGKPVEEGSPSKTFDDPHSDLPVETT